MATTYMASSEGLDLLAKELKPCPFCGTGHVEMVQNPNGKWSVFCRGCATSTKAFDTVSEPFDLWNSRK